MATWTTRVDERPEGAELPITDEPHTVGEELAGYVLLREVPRLRSPSTVSVRRASDGTSLAEVPAAPAPGQFRVVYGPRVRYTGAVEFAAADAGLAVLVSYEGTGSAVWARDVNRLQDEKVDRDGAIPFTGSVLIQNAASRYFVMDTGSGTSYAAAHHVFTHGTVTRWMAGKAPTAEADFEFRRFGDAGEGLGVPLAIRRSTGYVHVAERLGIGVASPTTALDVAGSGRFLVNAGAGLVLPKAGDAYRNFLRWNQGTVWWQAGFRGPPYTWVLESQTVTGTPADDTGWTTGLAVTTGGNVGIGITAPNAKLHVRGATVMQDSIQMVASTGYSHHSWKQVKHDATEATRLDLRRYTGTGDGFDGGEMVSFFAGGTVAIGATAPDASSSKLYIVGAVPGGGPNLRTRGDILLEGTSSVFFDGNYNYGTGSYIRAVAANTQAYFTSGAERMRITPDGSLLLNTTSDLGRLTVRGGHTVVGDPSDATTTSRPSHRVRLSSSWWTGTASTYESFDLLNQRTGAGNAAGQYRLSFQNDAKTVVGYLDSAGTLWAGSAVSTGEWFRCRAAGTGLYNEATARHLYSESVTYWRMSSDNGIKFYAGDNATLRGYVHHDTSGFGFLHSGGGWAVRTATSHVELYGTTYADTVVANVVHANRAASNAAGGISLYGTDPSNYGIFFRGTGTGSAWGNHGTLTDSWATYFNTYGNSNARGWIFRNTESASNVASISAAGHATFNGNLRSSSIYTPNWFRSEGNSGWHNETYGGGIYMDEASTVKVYNGKAFYVPNQISTASDVRFSGYIGNDNTFGMYFDSSRSPFYGIFREGGAWTNPFPDLWISFHTGIKIGAHYTYGGVRFYNGCAGDPYTELMSVGNGDGNVRIANDLLLTGSGKGITFPDGSRQTTAEAFTGVRAYRATGLSVSGGNETVIGFDAESFDTGTHHDNTTNNGRFTASKAGKWMVVAQVAHDSSRFESLKLTRIRKNGTTYVAETMAVNNYSPVMAVVQMAANDYIEVRYYTDEYYGMPIVVGESNTYCQFYYLGA